MLVTFAVDAEFAPWRNLRAFSVRDDRLLKTYVSKIAAVELNVLLTGIGGKSAWLETTKRLWKEDIDICISSGLAGGLRAEYGPGDILVPRFVTALAGQRHIACDPVLERWAVRNGARAVDSFYSTETVILTSTEKQKLGERADAVEMESGEVLYQAAGFGARVVAIRGISDAADEDLPLDFNRVRTATGEVSMVRVLQQVARNPSKIPALLRFGKRSQMAAEKLCTFLEAYVVGLADALGEPVIERTK